VVTNFGDSSISNETHEYADESAVNLVSAPLQNQFVFQRISDAKVIKHSFVFILAINGRVNLVISTGKHKPIHIRISVSELGLLNCLPDRVERSGNYRKVSSDFEVELSKGHIPDHLATVTETGKENVFGFDVIIYFVLDYCYDFFP
jgi:hypothetical protein